MLSIFLLVNDSMVFKTDDDAPRIWKVRFASGTLKAVGSNGGKPVATYALRTAGKPAKILLAADRMRISPVWNDVSFITATIVDENGVHVPTARDLVAFKIVGSGFIAAVDSADNNSHEPFQATERRAFQGRCAVMLKANAASGQITLEASAAGLTSDTITIAAFNEKR